jgi:antitoxin (DNA-binding transcriptional repressor) of toxin-antitoxin stability system
MWHIAVMPSVNMRELRDTRRLKAWLKAGKTVELRDRDRVIGRIVPEPPKEAPVEWPDFAARAKAILRGRRVSGADLLIEEREKSRY